MEPYWPLWLNCYYLLGNKDLFCIVNLWRSLQHKIFNSSTTLITYIILYVLVYVVFRMLLQSYKIKLLFKPMMYQSFLPIWTAILIPVPIPCRLQIGIRVLQHFMWLHLSSSIVIQYIEALMVSTKCVCSGCCRQWQYHNSILRTLCMVY